MIRLFEKSTGREVAQITDEQLRYMVEQLEEETLTDRDYSITPLTIEYFASRGADQALIASLEKALNGREEVIIEWGKP
jgi:hypothetical protein